MIICLQSAYKVVCTVNLAMKLLATLAIHRFANSTRTLRMPDYRIIGAGRVARYQHQSNRYLTLTLNAAT
jgi:hypothetical protein